MPTLRFITYLAPSLPRELFAFLARRVGEKLGVGVSLAFEERFSGPPPGEPDPFSTGAADIGFICSAPYYWLSANRPSPVVLLQAAPVFDDPRAAGRPVYFSDVIVARAHPAASLAALRGGRWAYNDTCSVSGYISLIRHLGNAGSAQAYFGEVCPSGSHLESMRRVAAGEADAAAIDSNVLALWRRRDPPLVAGLRILESWGPFPIQPAVARATLDPDRRDEVAAALRSLPNEPDTARALAEFGLIGFTGFPASLYEEEREALTACLGTP